MPVHVEVVPAKPSGALKRISLLITSGHRAGRWVCHGDSDAPIACPASDQAAAVAWARETGYTVSGADDQAPADDDEAGVLTAPRG